MGIVYLGHDPRLDREVAIKVLPEHLDQDADWVARFSREAKLLASLNHTNIATVYGLEETDRGARSLVLERVEGETLAARLSGDRLSMTAAFELCGQIAAALEAAHERGVIHRDLKPGNVMVTASGHVKVLDFGLARSSSGDGTQSLVPTLTETDSISGTPGYMSPEQALGAPHDKRTDIFSFGCVLFECLSGRRAFGRKTAAETIAALLKEQPDWSALPADTPSRIRVLVERCLEKNAQDRLRDIGDARIEIEEALGTRHTATPAPAPARARTSQHFPKPLTSFVGREKELTDGRRLLGETRLLTLTGVGGCGKSRLMLRLAESIMTDYPDGVWFLDLAPLSDPLRVPEALVAALGVQEEASRTLTDTLADHLRDKRALILLDNCEQMLGAAAEVAGSLLQGCVHVRIVATSRETLAIPGETTYQVPSMPLPDPRAGVDAISRSDAVHLFVERAIVVRPNFKLDEQSAPVVAEICRRLDGIPLAIELAAARVKVLAVDEIRARLDDMFRLLTGGSRATLPRHQTLRATVQWSYDLLSPPEQELLRNLSVFAGGWTLEAATAVAGENQDEFEVLDGLGRLVDKSLVVMAVEGSGTRKARYRFLETVRQYALEKLNEAGQGQATRDRHLHYFLGLASNAELIGPHQVRWFALLEAEHENLLAAISWCLHADEGVEPGLQLAGALWRFWSVRGHLTLGREMLDKVLRRDESGQVTAARCTCLRAAGALALNQGDIVSARTFDTQALTMARELGDHLAISAALNGLGMVSSSAGDLAAARDFYEQSLASAREAGYDRGMAVAYNNLADVAMILRDYDAARPLLEASLKMHRRRGDASGERVALINLAQICTKTGDTRSGRSYFIESLRIVRDLGSRWMGAQSFEAIGELALVLGDVTRMPRLFGAAEAIRQATGGTMTSYEREIHDSVVTAAHKALGDERFAALEAEGRAMSFEAAVEYALAWLEEKRANDSDGASPRPGN
jgi:non-specific serine/threonine protein kinase